VFFLDRDRQHHFELSFPVTDSSIKRQQSTNKRTTLGSNNDNNIVFVTASSKRPKKQQEQSGGNATKCDKTSKVSSNKPSSTNSTMNINTETGEALRVNGRSPRFTLWVAFFAFATITMGSAVSVKNAIGGDGDTANARWAVFCSAFSFAITGVVVLMHLHPLLSVWVVGTKMEGLVSIVLAAFWAATVAVVSNASTGLAVDTSKDNTIVNGNL
jgi:hypothetical protein